MRTKKIKKSNKKKIIRKKGTEVLDNIVDEMGVLENIECNNNQTFEQELRHIINKHSVESENGDTPDFILTKYIMNCLYAWKTAIKTREAWFGSNKLVDRVGNVVIKETDNVTITKKAMKT